MPRVKKIHKQTEPISPIVRRKKKSFCGQGNNVLVVHLSVAEEMATGPNFQYTMGPQPLGPLALPSYMSHIIVDKSPKLPLKVTDGELYATVHGVLKKIRLIAFDEEGEKWKKIAERFQNSKRRKVHLVNMGIQDAMPVDVQDEGPVVSDISPQELQTIQEALRHYRKKDERTSKSTQTSMDPDPPLPKAPMSPSTSRSPKLIEFANRLKSLADTLYKATEVLPAPALEDLEELFDVDWMVDDMDKMVVGVISFQNGTGDDEKKRWRSGGKNEKRLFHKSEQDTAVVVHEPRSTQVSKSQPAAVLEPRSTRACKSQPILNAPQPIEPVTVFKTLTKKRLATMPVPKPALDPPPESHKLVEASRRMMCYICRYDKNTSLPSLRVSVTDKLCKECGDMPLCDACFPFFHNVS